MLTTIISVLTLAALAAGAVDPPDEDIIALERAALDRWGKGDPQGYLELYGTDITYFDPSLERRADGLQRMKELYFPIAGKIKVDRYEFIGTKVQRQGDVAVLTFNLVSHRKGPSGEAFAVRWNTTEVYARQQGKWQIIHSHWSYTRPDLKQTPPQE